ncbi:helix-turn-helix domain-containing protein [Bacillus sp. ISL-41]|uniref:helix-turn-helix domain-containing protein n=1 Tax=Bacillus sp. ISL-41 TaxID=2819127 RepID=UPI001BEA2021|nr:helix-turn-helix domain-containing protein [Bacillus sp. ISL-41]MBT2641285.1 helix-turn-helix domain-containing protein [Bacillus sp. ISL-41]
MKYLTTKEASDILGITINKVRYLLQRNTFTDVIRGTGRTLISENDIEEYKKHLELLDTLFTIPEASSLLGFSENNLYKHYVKKNFFTTVQMINNHYYVSKAEIHKLIEENKSYYEMTDFKTTEETAKHLNLHVETVLRHITKGSFPNAIKSTFYSSSWKIPNRDIISFKARIRALNEDLKEKRRITREERLTAEKERLSTKVVHEAQEEPKKRKRILSTIELELSINYYTVGQIAQYFGVNSSTIYARIEDGLFKDIHTTETNNKRKKYFISKTEVHSIPFELIKTEKLTLNTSFEDRVSYYLKRVKNEAKIEATIEIFKDYVTHLYSNTRMRQKHALINVNGRMFVDLSTLLTKELHNHTDAEIMNLIASSTKHKKQLIGFLNFILAVKSDECKFRNKYNYTSKIHTQMDKEIYSRSEFKQYYDYVKNISIHKEKSLLQPEYAETWFYIFMHMTNAWRRSDILNFPLINFSEIPNDYIERVLNDGIPVSDAQSIINIVSEQWERFVISKTKVLNKFLVNMDMLETASTILLTIELHRRKENYNNEYLLPLMQKRSSFSPLINSFFHAHPTLKSFSSRIANRSLMTYFFHSVSKGSKNGDVAHLLAQRLRRHMDQDTVSQYVMNTNEDEFLDDTSYNLFKRGHFGWLYNSLVDIAINKKELKLSLEEKTRIIELYQQQYSPSEIEEISSYFLEQQNKQKSIALEIALLPNDEIEKRLYSIYVGAMPSKEEYSQCFYSENCKNPTGNCKTCPYIIPRTHLLTSLKNDLVHIISDIRNLDEHDVYERIRKTHILYKLLGLVSQSIKSFDKEYVNSFIALKPLETSLEAINDKIYLPERN